MKDVKEASDFVPFNAVLDDYCYSSYGDVVFGLKIEMSEVFSMSGSSSSEGNSEAEIFYHNWKKALKSLPENTSVQKISNFSVLKHKRNDSSNSKTMRWNEEMFLKRDVMFEETHLVISFQTAKNVQDKRSFLDRVVKFKEVNRIDEYKQVISAFISSLNDFCINVASLSGFDLVQLFINNWNGCNNDSDMLQDVSVNKDGLTVGEKSVMVLTARKLPVSFNGFTNQNRKITDSLRFENSKLNHKQEVNLSSSYLFPVGMGFPVEHTIIETIVIEGKENINSKLDKEHQGLNLLVGIKNSDAIEKRKVISETKKSLTENDYSYASWGLTIIVRAESRKKANELGDMLFNVGDKQLGIIFAKENYSAWSSFYSSLPGASRQNKNLRLTFLEICSYMTHIESFKKGNSNGIVLVDMFGKPFLFDFWDEENNFVNSRNGLIFAPTGGGKSFLVNHILDQCFTNGDTIFLIDVGGSYKRITALNNGVYIDSREINNLEFNPFLDCYKADGNYYPELDSRGKRDGLYLEFMSSLLILCMYDREEEMTEKYRESVKEIKDALKTTLILYYERVNKENCVVNFDEYYKSTLVLLDKVKNDDTSNLSYLDLKKFRLRMKPFSLDGEYSFLLNSEEKKDIKNRWITFDLVGIIENGSLSAPVLLIVIRMFERVMNRNFGGRSRMFIDEAIDFLKIEMFGEYVGGLYRKIRKLGGQIILITQNIDYLDSIPGEVRSSILGNTEVKILLDHSKVTRLFPKIQNELSLSNDEMELLNNQVAASDSNYRIGFIKFGKMKGFLFKHEVSPETFSLYQTDAKKIKMIDELIEKSNGNIESAVNSYVELNQ